MSVQFLLRFRIQNLITQSQFSQGFIQTPLVFMQHPPNMYAAKRIVGGGAKQDVIDKRLL